MFKINTLATVTAFTFLVLASTTAQSTTLGCERAGGVKCQKVGIGHRLWWFQGITIITMLIALPC
ncbi:hypothetical protein Sps_01579 [Shewanella psychrophila]|uniref:Uncharacterized protein n=1 Tax=Shewanella psychrophila TaxID=225848 RepID=A0A1S6HML2_9GAMM|nr:hypothetical protein Sps_01579 [Shewanella psychrophila]